MSTLVTSDLHLTANPRDAYRHDFMRKLPDMITRGQHKMLVINGDLTEEKDRHPAWLVNAIVGYIVACAKLVPVIINKGNHDYTDSDNPFFAFLKHLPKVRWISKPTLATDGDQLAALFLPHTTAWKKDWTKEQIEIAREVDWVFCHQTFEGTTMESGHVAGTVPRDLFGGANVLCGDVHRPHKLTNTITYIGAPYTVDFGDDYAGRLLAVYDGGYKSIHYLGRQKRFVELSANSSDVLVLKHLEKFRIGDIVKVRVRMHSGNRSAWPDVRRMVKEWADEMKYELHSVVPVIEKGAMKTTHKTHAQRSDAQLLDTYAKNKGLDAPTKKLGRILMRKV